MNKSDITINCIDCSEPFVWTAKDQEFMEGLVGASPSDGFTEVKSVVPPRRCRECRAKRKSLFNRN